MSFAMHSKALAVDEEAHQKLVQEKACSKTEFEVNRLKKSCFIGVVPPPRIFHDSHPVTTTYIQNKLNPYFLFFSVQCGDEFPLVSFLWVAGHKERELFVFPKEFPKILEVLKLTVSSERDALDIIEIYFRSKYLLHKIISTSA